MWCVHGAGRGRARARVRAADRRGGRPLGDDGRGAGGRRAAAAGVRGRGGAAVWLLHARDDHGRNGAPRGEPRSRRRADRQGVERQRLPLLRLPAHRPRRPPRSVRGSERPVSRAAGRAGVPAAGRPLEPRLLERARLVRRPPGRPGRRRRSAAVGGSVVDERRGLAPRGRRRVRHRVHGQGRRRPGQPDGALHARGGGARRPAGVGAPGDGRHRSLPVRHGHVRQPLDRGRRAAAARGGRGCGDAPGRTRGTAR